jgi:NAD(P)-dependent dehydrogenase (short-subunit alcohol dehydrogenase family)
VSGRVAGKVAIVTGAGRGIGRAEAMLLAAEGANVVVNDRGGEVTGGGRDTEVAQAVVEEIRALGGEAIASAEDVSDFAAAGRIVETALDVFGRVDILINNAGIIRPRDIDQMGEADWDDLIAVHLKGHFAMARHVAPHLIAQKGGAVVNTSSNSGLGHLGMSNYAAAKEGIVGFTRSIARDLGPHGVRCNAIRPGAGTRMVLPEVVETIRRSQEDLGFPGIGYDWITPRQTVATPDNVAAVALWLCTDAARDLNGRTLFIYGEELGLFSEPVMERTAYRPGGWTLEALEDEAAVQYLVGDAKNLFA